MMRMNWTISAGSRVFGDSSRVSAEPLIEVSGARSSWLTMARNSARIRSRASSGVRSWTVTTVDSNSPVSERIGVALTRTVTARPSGTVRTSSSARRVSLVLSTWTMGNSWSEISRPSGRRNVRALRSCSADWPGMQRELTILRPSRLMELTAPVRASKTTTPTGEVSISVSRLFLASCSSR